MSSKNDYLTATELTRIGPGSPLIVPEFDGQPRRNLGVKYHYGEDTESYHRDCARKAARVMGIKGELRGIRVDGTMASRFEWVLQ